MAKKNLNNVKFFGSNISVNAAKISEVNHNHIDSDKRASLTQDFSNTKGNYRYKTKDSPNFKNIHAPSSILHLSNLAKETDLQALKQHLFNKEEINILQHKAFSVKINEKSMKNMMLLKFESKAKAVEVLCKYHNKEINGKMVKISFTNN